MRICITCPQKPPGALLSQAPGGAFSYGSKPRDVTIPRDEPPLPSKALQHTDDIDQTPSGGRCASDRSDLIGDGQDFKNSNGAVGGGGDERMVVVVAVVMVMASEAVAVAVAAVAAVAAFSAALAAAVAVAAGRRLRWQQGGGGGSGVGYGGGGG